MKPAFKKLRIEWRGWYALRRGATDYLLLDMQLEFDEVRTILRHDSRSKVLEKHYAPKLHGEVFSSGRSVRLLHHETRSELCQRQQCRYPS